MRTIKKTKKNRQYTQKARFILFDAFGVNSRPIWHVINKHKTMANTRLFVCLPAEPVTYPGVLCLCPEQTGFSRGRLSNQLKTLVHAAHFSRDNDANIFTAALPTLSDCKRAARSLSREPGRRRRRAGASEVPGFITDTRIKSQNPKQNHHVGYCR